MHIDGGESGMGFLVLKVDSLKRNALRSHILDLVLCATHIAIVMRLIVDAWKLDGTVLEPLPKLGLLVHGDVPLFVAFHVVQQRF